MRFLSILSCIALARAQLLVQPAVKEETFMHKLKLGEKDVDVSMTIKSTSTVPCDPSVRQYSGYFDTGPVFPSNLTQRKLFFWFFESRNEPAEDPVVLWMTGGPGCSGMLAALVENGPCFLTSDGVTTVNNPNSWNTKANVMWIDQPAGTGFSVGSNDGYMYENIVGDHVYGFLQNFFQYPIFSKYRGLDFFITGESYGGHYVPSVAHRVWQGNEAKEGLHINLKGIAIGNGLTNPLEQYQWYPSMAFDGGKSEGGTAPGVISESVYNQMIAMVEPCQDKISQCKNSSTFEACQDAQTFCNNAFIGPYEATGMNVYDQRIKCEVPGLCYNFSKVDAWLNNPSVQQLLGVDKKWESCNYNVNAQFQGDWMLPQENKLVPLLDDAGIRVLIYAGDCDFICNWLGNKHWALKLDWQHKTEFNDAEEKPYMVNSQEAGKLRSDNGFSFLQIYGAGHMVPMDQPVVALQMITDFFEGTLDQTTAQKLVV
jgi:cathepsin A (carboxypeptidase C)